MSGPAFVHDLFLLVGELFKTKNKQRVLDLFVEAINEWHEEVDAEFAAGCYEGDELSIPIATSSESFGRIVLKGNLQTVPPDHMAVLRNATMMVALILENRAHEARMTLERNQFFDLSRDMMGIAGSDGYFKTLNQRWEKILGWTNEELLSKPFVDFVHPDDVAETVENLDRHRAGEPVLCFLNRYRCKDGSFRWLDWTMVAVEGTFFTVARDITKSKEIEDKLRKAHDELEVRVEERTRELSREITERKYAEASLQQANAELENRVEERTRNLKKAKEESEFANYAKTQFLANMSHELRTPLNGILGFSEMMLSETFGPLAEKYKGYATDIYISGQHLLGLVTDILDISKLEKGSLDLDETEVNLCRMAIPCMRLTQKQADSGQVALSLDMPDDFPRLFADETRVKQILINLLSNAVKFTPPKGKVSLDAHCDDDRAIILQVKDTGRGIAAYDIPKVMEPFVQVDDIMTRSHEGAGLGLPLSRRLTELHDGTLDIESEVGVGTTVTVRFPPERTLAS